MQIQYIPPLHVVGWTRCHCMCLVLLLVPAGSRITSPRWLWKRSRYRVLTALLFVWRNTMVPPLPSPLSSPLSFHEWELWGLSITYTNSAHNLEVLVWVSYVCFTTFSFFLRGEHQDNCLGFTDSFCSHSSLNVVAVVIGSEGFYLT